MFRRSFLSGRGRARVPDSGPTGAQAAIPASRHEERPPAFDPEAWRQVAPTQLLASRHQAWEAGLPAGISTDGVMPPTILAVGGGKGGVGKSLISANLAIGLAAMGHKVLAIDLDVGGANLHTYFGISQPKYTLADALLYNHRSLRDVLIPTGFTGLSIIAGGREEAWGGASYLEPQTQSRLYEAVLKARRDMGYDFILLDLGAGTQRHTIDFFSMAHLGLMVVLPEPTSIENAYLFLKTSLFRYVDHVGARTNAQDVAEKVKSALASSETSRGATRDSGYAERLRQIGTQYPEFVSQLNLAVSGRTVGLLVNQARSQNDIDIGKSMELISERYFGFSTHSCGYLNYDEAAWKSLRNRRPLTVDFPHSIIARRFVELTRSALTQLGF